MKVRAAIQTGDSQITVNEIELPTLEPGEVLLRIEGCGMCGSDLESYRGATVAAGIAEYPLVPGHEPVGRIERISHDIATLWGVDVGDRIAVEPFVPCGVCDRCTEGAYQLCLNRFIYCCMPTTLGTGIWGGFSEYMVLKPASIVHRVPEHLSIQDAVLFNPIGAGFEWAYKAAGTQVGDTIVIFGPGQRGLGSVVAAVEAGASRIVVTGLERDAHKLELALSLGATDVIKADSEDVVARVVDITDGALADRVVDVTSGSVQPVLDAVEVARPGGTIVLAGLKDQAEIAGFVSDRLVFKSLTMRGVLGVSSWSFRQAIRVIASGRYDFSSWHTHTLGLDDLEHAIALLGGSVANERVVHITVVP
jgi:threonine dehydrogenase-like Zn-dependent dehydrogenase